LQNSLRKSTRLKDDDDDDDDADDDEEDRHLAHWRKHNEYSELPFVETPSH